MQVPVIEYFSILKMIVIKIDHALEFMVGSGLIGKFPVFGYIFILTSSKWNIVFHYYSEIV